MLKWGVAMTDENQRDDDDLLLRLEGGDEQALTELFARHREVLALRHFEELSNGAVSHVLGLSKTAASNRYMRALARLKEMLQGMPGFLDD
jgi:DNA-directed RNA polymerase specialized sigma24 family protein